MKKIGLAAVALVVSANAYAGTGEELSVATLDAFVSNGNQASVIIKNGAIGYLMRPLSITGMQQLIFPDLVIPSTGIDVANSVRVVKADPGVSVTYGGTGNPGDSSSLINSGANTLTATLGRIDIAGHANKVITVNISPIIDATNSNVDNDKYVFTIIEDSSAKHSSGGYLLTGAGGLNSGGDAGAISVEFGGELSVKSGINTGYVSTDLDVTVNYRGS